MLETLINDMMQSNRLYLFCVALDTASNLAATLTVFSENLSDDPIALAISPCKYVCKHLCMHIPKRITGAQQCFRES